MSSAPQVSSLSGRELLRGGYLPMARLGRPRRVEDRFGRPGYARYRMSVFIRRDKVGELDVELSTYGNGALHADAELRRV